MKIIFLLLTSVAARQRAGFIFKGASKKSAPSFIISSFGKRTKYLNILNSDPLNSDTPTFRAAPISSKPATPTTIVDDVSTTENSEKIENAATNTINARLLEELERQTEAQNAPKSELGRKAAEIFGTGRFSTKTDAERERDLAAARDLNGVNPVVAITGSLVAFGIAFGMWRLTTFLGAEFLTHPVDSDVYFIQRAAAVFRNAVMGIVSLASGFFGVTALGIFGLGVRVGYGVMTGELDPTPIKKIKKGDDVVLPNVWDLMTGKTPGRKRR